MPAPRCARHLASVAGAALAVALLGAPAASAAPPPDCAVAGPQPTVIREAPAPPDDITADGLIAIPCTGATPVTLVVDQAPHDGNAGTSDGPGLVRYVISHGGYVGLDTFVVHGHNADGDSAPVTVNVNVTKAPESGPPCPKQWASALHVRSGEQRALSLPCPGASGGTIVAGPDHGTAATPIAGADGVLRVPYTAAADYTGSDYVLVRAVDANGQATDPKLLPVVVVDPSTNSAPLCPSRLLPLEIPQPLRGATELTTSCLDSEGDPLSYAITAQPAHGTVTPGSAPDRLRYTPAIGYAGGDSFQFVVSDGHGGSTADEVLFSVDTSLPVAPLPLPPPVRPAVPVKAKLTPAASVRLTAATLRLQVTSSVAGRVTIGLGLPKAKTTATFTRSVRKGTTTLHLRLPKALRGAVTRHRAKALVVKTRLRAKDGRTVSASRTVKLHRG
jgi:hypothetical protein